jgi:enediyne biosynthesis protein E4
VVWDYEGDGWPDLVVAQDMEPNLLFRNNHDGTFTERGVESGIALSSEGKARAGMGIDTADTTNSGLESVLIGNNTSQGLAQYLPNSQGLFIDVAEQTGLFEPSLQLLTFGLVSVDYDGDGRKDIITANGHIDENVALNGGGITFPQKLVAFHNTGDRFVPAGEELGSSFHEARLWRGLAVGDFDNDGDPDLLVSSCGGKPALLRNDGGNRNHWLQVKAIAAGRNREGIGTKVIVTAGGQRQTGWIRSGSSYCSQSELTAFFGLGSATNAEQVELFFPSGARQVVRGVRADQRIVVQEGRGIVTPKA